MTPKARRQKMIAKIVREGTVRTQADLQRVLRRHGFPVDQATVSRDIRELGLVKVPDGSGRYRYVDPADTAPGRPPPGRAVLARFVRSLDASGNLIVIRTDSGTAPLVGEAIDRVGPETILGTVAGDNTVLAVIRRGVRRSRALRALRQLVQG